MYATVGTNVTSDYTQRTLPQAARSAILGGMPQRENHPLQYVYIVIAVLILAAAGFFFSQAWRSGMLRAPHAPALTPEEKMHTLQTLNDPGQRKKTETELAANLALLHSLNASTTAEGSAPSHEKPSHEAQDPEKLKILQSLHAN